MKHLNRAGGSMINHEGIIMAYEYIDQFKKSLNGYEVRGDLSLEY